jgi:hypothetical protein
MRLLYENGSVIRDLNGVAAEIITFDDLSMKLYFSKCRFLRVYSCSNRNSRLRKTDNPYRHDTIDKVVVATVRNGYRFYESVEREVVKQGGNPADVERIGRQWGRHLRGSDHFTVHRNRTDGVNRLHAYLMPVKWHSAEYVGYYVNGVKVDDAELRPFEYQRRAPATVADAAKQKRHPWEPRLENILYIKLSGVFYRIAAPTQEEVNALAEAAEENEPAAV